MKRKFRILPLLLSLALLVGCTAGENTEPEPAGTEEVIVSDASDEHQSDRALLSDYLAVTPSGEHDTRAVSAAARDGGR